MRNIQKHILEIYQKYIQDISKISKIKQHTKRPPARPGPGKARGRALAGSGRRGPGFVPGRAGPGWAGDRLVFRFYFVYLVYLEYMLVYF